MKEIESYQWTQFMNENHQSCSDEGSRGSQFSNEHFLNVESSSAPSTTHFSVNGSPETQPDSQSYQSAQLFLDCYDGPPISKSFHLEDVDDLKCKLKELESAMLGTDSDSLDIQNISYHGGTDQSSLEPEKLKSVREMISRWDLKQVLITCASAVSENDSSMVEWLMSELRQMVSVSGEPIQRLGAYMLEGLVARFASSGSYLYKSLRCKDPVPSAFLSYMHLLYEICPYFKFAYVSANGAIAEAMKDENTIHIIDFQIAQGAQWFSLIQALAARPGGPPHIRITGIDDPVSAYAREGGLDVVGKRLSMLAESCKVSFEFHAGAISGTMATYENLGVRPGEALAVNFPLVLHHMPDESVGPNHRDRLVRLAKSLSPKVVTLVEQESNTNNVPFLPRFIETLNYYMAVFESIDATLPRDHKERISVEQHCLARDIVNLIACEGGERVERHELLAKWKSRFVMAGFTPFPLSSVVHAAIKTLLESYSNRYMHKEHNGALYLGWMDRPLVASCAWR